MSAPVSTAAGYAPLFDWGVPRSRKVVLLSFLAASFALHALCFYIFQIIYPPTVALLPPPARVNIITPATEEGRVLLRWIEAEDPALSSTTQRPPDAAPLQLPQAAHRPSYAGRKPQLRELPPYLPNLSIPSARPPAPVPSPRASIVAQPATVATSLQFQSADWLGQPVTPPASYRATRRETPESAQFRVAIDPRGAVRYCLLENSSGDGALDEEARAQLLRTRFPAAPVEDARFAHGLFWTEASVEWGNDLLLPESPAKEAPAP